MRIRSIKPEFWRSEDISALDVEDRLLFVGLWSYVDDNGVGVDRLATVAADLFASDIERDPTDTFARVSRGLQNLSEAGLIERYEVDGKRFLHITNWEKHQRIDKPNKPRYPLPTSGNEIPATSSRDSREIPAPGTEEQGNRGAEEQPSPPAPADAQETTPAPDVEAICNHLADRIEANGARRPTITKTWRKDARLLLHKDGYTPQQIHWLIDWCQTDTFWRTNILSMTKLREKFEQLKLKALAETQPVVSKRQQEVEAFLAATTTQLEVTQ